MFAVHQGMNTNPKLMHPILRHMAFNLTSTTALALSSIITASIFLTPITAHADQTVASGTTVNAIVSLSDGETLTVATGGTLNVSGDNAVDDDGNIITAIINNSGDLISTNRDAIDLRDSTLSLTNNSNATISGDLAIDVNTLTNLVNNGLIQGNSDGAIDAETITNLINNSSGSIVGADEGIKTTTLVSLTNSGTITGGQSYYGINADTITMLTNNSGGTISGDNTGIKADSITSLTNGGTIIGNDIAIEAKTITNLTNSGSITGNNASAIKADIIASLTNSGTIIGNDEGIDVNNAVTVYNLVGGTITALSDGIKAGDNSKITNWGTIKGGDEGVELDNNSSVVNYGTIKSGPTDEGVQLGFDASVKNTGTINGGSTGIQIASGRVENSGSITGVIGIEAISGAGNITNSGTVEGTGGIAIKFRGNNSNTLNLNAGSILIGTVDMRGPNDILNFGTGLSTLVKLSRLEPITTNFSSPVNYSDTTTRAQADVSSLGAMRNLLSDITRGIGGVAKTRIDTANNSGSNTGTNYWLSRWGSFSSTQSTSSFSQTNLNTAGNLFGADRFDNNGNLVGIYGGSGSGQIAVNVINGQATNTRSFYSGLYSKQQLANGNLNFDLKGGALNFDSERFSDGQNAKAKFRGYFIAPTVGYSKKTTKGQDKMKVSVSAGYSGLFLNRYTEEGLTAGNLSVASRDIHQLNARGELSWFNEIEDASGQTTTITPYLGLEGAMSIGSNNATVDFMGKTTTFNTGNNDTTARTFAGARFNKTITNTMSLFGSVEVSTDIVDNRQLNAQLGLSVRF